MNLAYNILWFEDSEEWIDSMQEKVEDFFFDFGFLLNLDIQKNANNLDSLMKQINSHEKDIDIILMDYNLLHNDKGSDLIKKIRSKEIFTEIIFYSEKTKVKEKFKDECIEGIYFSERDTLLLRLKQIIPHTIKKVIDLTNMRGIVMSETSLLDIDLNNLILAILEYIDKKDSCKRQLLIDKVFQKRLEHAHTVKEIEHEVKKIANKDTKIFKLNTTEREEYLKDIIQLLEKVESSDRYQFVNKLMKEPISNKLAISEKHVIFKLYDTEIIKQRNILAHVKEDIIDGKKVLKSSFKGYEEFTFSHEDFKLIRQDLIKHKDNIVDMIEHINKKIADIKKEKIQ
jgi:CheY-like chemotaxis protein